MKAIVPHDVFTKENLQTLSLFSVFSFKIYLLFTLLEDKKESLEHFTYRSVVCRGNSCLLSHKCHSYVSDLNNHYNNLDFKFCMGKFERKEVHFIIPYCSHNHGISKSV